MLKESINSLIASGKRNFAIDMSPLDYIYSDTINMLMALNRRVLDVTGRLSLMSPQPEVLQILKRAGIHNILRIFETETELIKSSEDLILQTSSIKLSDVNAIKQATPQSEFDQLRSEIGSVFGSGVAGSDGSHDQPSGHEDEFDQMFQQFEPHVQKTMYVNPPMAQQPPPYQPPAYQPHQYQPSGPQPIPLRPTPPISQRQAIETPKYTPEYSSRSETQRFPTSSIPSFEENQVAEIQPPKKNIKIDTDDLFDSSSKRSSAKKIRIRDDFDSFNDDELNDEFKKKSVLPALIIVLLILILGGVGVSVIYFASQNKKSAPIATTPSIPTTTPDQQPPAPAQVPVDTQSTTVPPPPPPPSVTEPIAKKEPPKEIVESKPEISPPVRKSPVQRARRSSYTAPAKSVESVPEETEAVTKNQIVFSSSPKGATISINGQNVGTTPYTWRKPFFGTINLQISKPGYVEVKKSFEFTGGSMNEFFSLEKEVAETPSTPAFSKSMESEPEEPEESTPIAKVPPTRATSTSKTAPLSSGGDDEDLFDDVGDEETGDDFSLESERESEPVTTKRPTTSSVSSTSSSSTPTSSMSTPSTSSSISSIPSSTSAMTSPRSTSSSSSSMSMGGDAQIFIASIPPVADVYINDRLVGKTNVSELKLPAGVQSLRFVKGGKEITKEFTLKAGKNPSQMVRIP